MKSIRAQLLGWLLPGFVVVCAAAGVGVYFSERQAFEADLDAALGKLAGSARLALRNQPAAGPMVLRAPGLRSFLAREEFQAPGQYFQQWSPDGATLRKSPNLHNADLPQPTVFAREAVRYNGVLANGDRVRVSAMHYPAIGPTPAVNFAVALSRQDGDARLAKLIIELVIGGIACCALLSGLLALALRASMRPLTRLGEQVAAMSAGSLHERFPADSMPSEIAPIVARLNDLMARLEQSFERERRFSGDLAHELRTPLAAIRATSEVAAKWPEQSTAEDYTVIAQSAARLQQIVDSLLLLARAETSSASLVGETVALRPIIEECVAQHAQRARERDLTLTLRLDVERELKTDAQLLRIIVMNLVANAVEYAPLHSEVTLTCDGTDRLFEIVNPAPALTAEDITHLFERLWRKDDSRSDASHSGLGLSLARSCSNALGLALIAELDASGHLRMSLRGEK